MRITKVVGLLCITLGFSSMNFASAYAQTTPEQKVSITEAQLVLPQGEVLEEQALADVEGEGVPVWLGSAALGAGIGAGSQVFMNATSGQPWHSGVTGAAVLGGISGAVNPVSTGTKLIKVGGGLYKVVKPVNWGQVGRSAGSAFGGGALGGGIERGIQNRNETRYRRFSSSSEVHDYIWRDWNGKSGGSAFNYLRSLGVPDYELEGLWPN